MVMTWRSKYDAIACVKGLSKLPVISGSPKWGSTCSDQEWPYHRGRLRCETFIR